MSKKFEICSATYNIALNQDANDVFGIGCAHLYHFLHGNGNHGRSEECKPMMLKMHLELNELIEETEEQIVEPSNSNNPERPFIQQPEAKVQSLEDSLQSTDDVVNKIIKRMEQLEKNLLNIIVNKETDVGNNSTDHESNNDLISISDNASIQSTLQLEAKLKTLEDALQASNADAVNKLMERMEKLENNISKNIVDKTPGVDNNTIDHESNNDLLSSSDNFPRQSVQQIQAKLKTLEDVLQAKDDVINKLMEFLEKKFDNNFSNIIVNKATDVDNNTMDHDSNNALLNSTDNAARQSVQQLYKEVKALKDRTEQPELNKAVNETADIGNPTTHDNSKEKQQQQTTKHNSSQKPSNNGSDGKEYQMTPKEKQEIQFDRNNLVLIGPTNFSDSRLDTAIHNVIQYAKEMDLSLTRDQIKHIDVRMWNQDYLHYYVFFRARTIKEAFLMKCDILTRYPYYLEIQNELEYSYNSVYIRNFKSSDLKEDSAIVNVIGLANQMGLTLMRDQIKWIEVFRVNQTCLVCHVNFATAQVKDEFLKKSHILKELPETKSLEIY